MDLVATHASCPGCRGTLARLALSDSLVAVCRGCGGMWIDNKAARWVLSNQLSEEARAFVRSFTSAGTDERRGASGYRERALSARSCPVCAADLTATKMKDPPLTVDICSEHGSYFDDQELATIVTTLELRALQPMVDRDAERASAAWEQRQGQAFATRLFDPPRQTPGEMAVSALFDLLLR